MDTCGAKTRAGTPCKQKAIYWNGRCKFHGGLATGPKTEAGKEQCRINGRKGGRPRKDSADAEALLLSDVAISEAIETETMQLGKTSVSKEIPRAVLGRAADYEMSKDVHVLATQEQREIIPEKPKSCMLKDVHVLPNCSRCEMLASNGACLAVAKGLIPCVPASETCAGFVDFEKT